MCSRSAPHLCILQCRTRSFDFFIAILSSICGSEGRGTSSVLMKVQYPAFCSLTLADVRPLTWRVETPLLIAVKLAGLKAPRTTTCTAVAGFTSTLSSWLAGSLRMHRARWRSAQATRLDICRLLMTCIDTGVQQAMWQTNSATVATKAEVTVTKPCMHVWRWLKASSF